MITFLLACFAWMFGSIVAVLSLMRAAARQMPRPNFRGHQLRKLANSNPRFFV